MTLIKSISGIRGTIGGKTGENLTPPDIVRYVAAFSEFISLRNEKSKISIVVGRDARVSGEMVNQIVCGTLLSMGVDVIDAGLSTTPTVEMAVVFSNADGGIIITASHNPGHWNALKLLNEKGEFISADDGMKLLSIAENQMFYFNEAQALGSYQSDSTFLLKHIEKILSLHLVDIDVIRKAGFKVVIDCVNSTGGLALPLLLKYLGVEDLVELYCTPNGKFPHNPEPLPENLTEISSMLIQHHADVGFAVDPDVDRLAIVMENGMMFGEEYTLVSIADFVLSQTKGNTVSNLSSTKALREITQKHACQYFPSAVGEVNVVQVMKENNAIIGGEGNGGIIYPELHYGRDALLGIALFLTYLAKSGLKCSQLRQKYPDYYISKNKMELEQGIDVDLLLQDIQEQFRDYPVNTKDGVRIDFDEAWVHLRKSNTEPIIRIYSESDTKTQADQLAGIIIQKICELIKK